MRLARLGVRVSAGIAAFLAGCATATDQLEILVDTRPPGASCFLERQGRPIATLAATPAIALVEASDAEITVRCHRNGFADAAVTLHPRPEKPVFGRLLGPSAGPYEQRVDIALVPR